MQELTLKCLLNKIKKMLFLIKAGAYVECLKRCPGEDPAGLYEVLFTYWREKNKDISGRSLIKVPAKPTHQSLAHRNQWTLNQTIIQTFGAQSACLWLHNMQTCDIYQPLPEALGACQEPRTL